jgi:hypothetical protein
LLLPAIPRLKDEKEFRHRAWPWCGN